MAGTYRDLLPPGPCAYCGAVGAVSTVDHKKPRARGGTDDPENLVRACRYCNSSKGAMTPKEWLASDHPQAQIARAHARGSSGQLALPIRALGKTAQPKQPITEPAEHTAPDPVAADFAVALATRRVRELLDTTGPASDELRARVREIFAPVLARTHAKRGMSK